MILGVMAPRAFGIFVLLCLLRPLGAGLKAVMPDDKAQTRGQRVHEGKTIGWAEGARIYRIALGPFKIDFPVRDGKTMQALNFYYLRPSSFILRDLAAFDKKGMHVALHESMRVFEPGCNAGRMLLMFRDLYSANVTGLDLFAPAIKIAKKIGGTRADFRCANVLEDAWLKSLPDDYFDLSIASSFINHVSHLEGYEDFLQNLARISRQVYIHDRALDRPGALAALEQSMQAASFPRGREFIFFARKKG
ncbi:MAG: class I SAM-dependent methyltransferase [Alphaproteobacteria bacterium]|nr:class I SAM-dependent methyltransferase [Alphaproteobacteria bacterium]